MNGEASGLEIVIGAVAVAILLVIPLYRVMAKAGLNPALAFLIAIPGFGYLIVIGILAFADWPNEPEGYR